MSTVALPPKQVATVPAPTAPTTVPEAVRSLHESSERMALAAVRLLELAELRDRAPEMRTIVINGAPNAGQYTVLDHSPWAAKSVGILNPGSAPVFVGIGGQSARPTSGVPSCPGASSLILPVEAHDIELGCDPAVLGANSTIVYLFRFLTVQPLALRQVP